MLFISPDSLARLTRWPCVGTVLGAGNTKKTTSSWSSQSSRRSRHINKYFLSYCPGKIHAWSRNKWEEVINWLSGSLCRGDSIHCFTWGVGIHEDICEGINCKDMVRWNSVVYKESQWFGLTSLKGEAGHCRHGQLIKGRCNKILYMGGNGEFWSTLKLSQQCDRAVWVLA